MSSSEPPKTPPQSPPQSPWGNGNTPNNDKQNDNRSDNRPKENGSPFGLGGGFGQNRTGQGPGRPSGGNGGNRGGNNGTPPDIDEMLRQLQNKLREIFPRSGKNPLAWVLGAILLVVWLGSGFYRVQEGQIGVVLRFGEVNRTEQPGLRYHIPAPFESVLTPNVTFENRIEIGFRSSGNGYTDSESDVPEESVMLTSDQNIIDLDFAVTWVVKNPSDFLFEIRDPAMTVKKAAESAMRDVIGQTPIQSALTEARDRIQQDTKKLLQQILDDYQSGVEIVRVELLRVNPPTPVVDAFNDVQRAEADRVRLQNEAEGYRNKVIPEARGEAERQRNEAEGYKEQTVNQAKGEASRFAAVWAAYQKSRDTTTQRLYLETMEQILRDRKKIIIDESKGGSGVIPYLPLNQLSPAATGGASGNTTSGEKR